jgi:hypothetical protein
MRRRCKKAIGHEGDGPIAIESHEKFAQSFEQYLMEGKAPSNALLGAFRRFKQWLTNIYKSVGGLGIKLNDTVAPNRSGKSRRALLPNLFALPHWSIIVNDVKGELARWSAKYREDRGSRRPRPQATAPLAHR